MLHCLEHIKNYHRLSSFQQIGFRIIFAYAVNKQLQYGPQRKKKGKFSASLFGAVNINKQASTLWFMKKKIIT